MHPRIQSLLPHHLLSRCVGYLANCRRPVGLKNWVIQRYIDYYGIDMQQAIYPRAEDYASFNAFFTRKLPPAQQLIEGEADSIISPVEGSIDQIGEIALGRLLQAKGKSYGLLQLLGNDKRLCDLLTGGQFITLYLSPKNYHRVHMPLRGELQQMRYLPGRLFSVNPVTAQSVNALFARNERVVIEFATALGPMVVVMVGAMLVAGIHTSWAGKLKPHRFRREDYRQQSIVLERGEELGHFQLGSTVIVLFPPDRMTWRHTLHQGAATRMGDALGELTRIIG